MESLAPPHNAAWIQQDGVAGPLSGNRGGPGWLTEVPIQSGLIVPEPGSVSGIRLLTPPAPIPDWWGPTGPGPWHDSRGIVRDRRFGLVIAQSRRASDMAKEYRLGTANRVVNAVFRQLTRLGLGASYRWILTVPGRKTKQLRSTPVDVMDLGGARWLVAGYGPANWVLNARAAGRVTLSRGRRRTDYDVTEAAPSEAVPVLRKYMKEVRVTRAYFDVGPDAPDSAIAAELGRHPTLRLTPVS